MHFYSVLHVLVVVFVSVRHTGVLHSSSPLSAQDKVHFITSLILFIKLLHYLFPSVFDSIFNIVQENPLSNYPVDGSSKLLEKNARGENTKINYGMDTTGEKEKRTSKKNVDGRSTSNHDNKKFRTRSMEKQRGMLFGCRKTTTAIKKKRTDRIGI
jgi:hypothetical protein